MKNSANIRCIRKYLRKDGSTTFHAEVRRKNAKPLRQSFRTLTDAKNWVRKVESSILDGRYVPDNKARKYNLSDLIEQYTLLHLSKFPRRLKDQSIHLNWWKEQYGKKPLIEVTPALLSQAREKLLSGITPQKKSRSNSTVNRYFSSLSRAFTLAFQEWQWINENPLRRVSKLKENGSRNRFLSRDELQALLESCKQSKNPHLYPIVLIAASMGLRFSECVNLRWKHIDFENGFVTLETTKNGDVGIVPLPDQVANCLQGIQRPKLPDEYVFPSKNPLKRHPYSLIRKAFQKSMQAIYIKDFTFHSLRHTCASHLAMNGASQVELQEILRHRSPSMTRRYVHFNRAHIAQLMQKTNDKVIGTQGDNS